MKATRAILPLLLLLGCISWIVVGNQPQAEAEPFTSSPTCRLPLKGPEGHFSGSGSGPALDKTRPQHTEKATFSLGCFWGAEGAFGAVPGVVSTRVGYSGGTTPEPHYGNIGDHAEAVQVTFDPEVISYPELLQVFWVNHNPRARPFARQYANAIFYHSDEQQRQAKEFRQARDPEATTPIIAFGEFHQAEDYHQKYYLGQTEELAGLYRDNWLDSTAATRANAYLSGRGEPEQFERDLSQLGLDEAGQQILRDWYVKLRP